MLFDEKGILAKNTKYGLYADISGPDSLRGRDGVSSVKCGEAIFAFFEFTYILPYPANKSNVQVGQFPEFLIA